MGTGKKKEYLKIEGGTVLSLCVSSFLKATQFDALLVLVPEGQEAEAEQALFADEENRDLIKATELFFVSGGKSRQESVFKALEFLKNNFSKSFNSSKALVLIHDAARPFVTKKIICETITVAKKNGAAVPAVSPVDTQKEIDSDKTIKRHLNRDCLCAVQTPQAFLLKEITLCHEEARKNEARTFTDDSEIWDSYPTITGGRKVCITQGDPANKKITYSQDIKKMTHIGLGTDLHRLEAGRKFMLGGIEIPCAKGEVAHSDGDVLLHAISDALLGASGLGDIGSYFPPEDSKWKDADSKLLIKTIWEDVKKAGWDLCNLDCVVETEVPKILPWRQKIIDSIAQVLEVSSDKIFVKAKTNEKQDAVGKTDAIKAYCVCLLER